MKIIFTSGLVTAVFLLTPVSVGAYETTGQEAKRMSDTTAAYFVTYKFGHESKDIYMPVRALRNQQYGMETTSIGYEILERSEFRSNKGTAMGIVLSNAEIVDGMYKVPKGYAASFTLLVLFEAADGEEETEYALQVTDLPFYAGENRDYQRLNPSELQYYATEGVKLHPTAQTKMLENVKVEVKSITYTPVKK